jgi:hypothetical protein
VGDRTAAAAGQGGVTLGDGEVLLDTEDGQRPSALEAAVDLDEHRADHLHGPAQVVLADGGAPVDDPPQRRRHRPSRLRHHLGQAGHHPGHEEGGRDLVAEDRLDDRSGRVMRRSDGSGLVRLFSLSAVTTEGSHR